VKKLAAIAILVIHILRIVANSAGCECAFSHMGLVHTGICSKLSVEKVHKTTMVGMDIKHSHLEAGLAHSCSKQNFTGFTSKSEAGAQELNHANLTTIANIADQEDGLMDFNQLTRCLIERAASASMDRDIGDNCDDSDDFPLDALTPAACGSLMITIPPLNSVSLLPQAAQLKKTSIPLEILFKYPTDTDPPSEGMNSFWRGGIKNVEKEMEAYEILNTNEEVFDGVWDETTGAGSDM
jgi:hypothetical protein